MKPCQFCAEEIQDDAVVCRHCSRKQLSDAEANSYARMLTKQRASNFSIAIYATFIIFFYFYYTLSLEHILIAFLAALIIKKTVHTPLQRQMRNRHNIAELDTLYQAYETKNEQAKERRNFRLTILGTLVIPLMLANPSLDEFKTFARQTHTHQKTELSVKRSNFLVCSIFELRISSGQTKSYLGILGNFLDIID